YLLRKNAEQCPAISAICISGNGPTIASDKFIHLWNEPNGTAEEAGRYAALSGRSLFLPKLLFCMKHYPSQWNASACVFSGPEYLIYELTGTALTILPEKRFEAAYWNDEALLRCGIDKAKLPPFVAPGFCAGNLTAAIAEKLDLSTAVKVYCGTPDFVAALIGTATLKAGRLCDRAGSSEGLNLCVDKPVSHEKIRTLPSVISSLWNASVLLPESGAKFANFKKNSEFRDRSPSETVLAILNDKNSEGYRLISDIAAEIKQSIAVLEKATGFAIKSMRVTGGQAHNKPWNQFKANTLGINIETTQMLDAELMGDAITAFTGMGFFSSIEEGAEALVKTAYIFEPHKTIGSGCASK
ncbi:MAG: hypothetical protein IKQ84_02655, partial [Spirochaetaceae bacterium]|nr:hypothetical protein [Spirochaetaceae bacterium]